MLFRSIERSHGTAGEVLPFDAIVIILILIVNAVVAMSCGVGLRPGWMWHCGGCGLGQLPKLRSIDGLFRCQAWELPYAAPAAPSKQTNVGNGKTKKRLLHLRSCSEVLGEKPSTYELWVIEL